MVNRYRTQPCRVSIDARGKRFAPGAVLHTVYHPDLLASNSRAEPDKLRASKPSSLATLDTVELPPAFRQPAGVDHRMNTIVESARTIPVIAEPDVLVAGGGPAGIGAAVAAARNGAKVMLLERYGFLGGNLTIAMVNPMFTFHDVSGNQVIRGIAGELVDRLVRISASHGHVPDLTFDNASMTPFDPEGMKIVLFDLVEEAGVDLLLHSTLADAVPAGRRIESVIIESKSGRQAIRPKIVIDCLRRRRHCGTSRRAFRVGPRIRRCHAAGNALLPNRRRGCRAPEALDEGQSADAQRCTHG